MAPCGYWRALPEDVLTTTSQVVKFRSLGSSGRSARGVRIHCSCSSGSWVMKFCGWVQLESII